MIRTSVAVPITVVLCLSSAVAQSRVTATFRDILSAAGLGHLDADDMAKVENLLDGMTKATTISSLEKAEALDSVADYLKAQGFEPELVMVGTRNGFEILIVGKVPREFTTDIPPSLNTSGLRNGIHFVRKSTLGITGIIADGKVHDLHLATWKPF